MDTGISREQIDAVKDTVAKWCADPISLRCLVSLVAAAVGVLAFIRPLSGRLETARTAHAASTKLLERVEDVAHWRGQIDRFAERTALRDDVVDWQRYVLKNLTDTEVRLLNLEPRQTSGKGVYKFVEMELVARGVSYSDFATVIHRLERGERIMRIERIRLERQRQYITLTCTLKGLCRPSLTAPPTPAPGVPFLPAPTLGSSSTDAGGMGVTSGNDEAAGVDTSGEELLEGAEPDIAGTPDSDATTDEEGDS